MIFVVVQVVGQSVPKSLILSTKVIQCLLSLSRWCMYPCHRNSSSCKLVMVLGIYVSDWVACFNISIVDWCTLQLFGIVWIICICKESDGFYCCRVDL